VSGRNRDEVKISYPITREDFIDAQKLHRSKSPGPLGRAIVLIGKILAGASILLLIVPAAVDRDRRLWANLAPLIILMALWLLGMLVWVPFNWRRCYAKDSRLHQEFTADISEEGVHLISLDFDANLKWSLYLRFLESDRVFLLHQTERLFNMFPKSAFTPGEIEAFRELARRKPPDK
jgi:hypothetical protein